MTRRIEAGPVLVGLGAVVVLVSLFLDWYEPNVIAWEAFEVLDLLMAALALAAIVAAVGTVRPDAAVIERHQLPLIVAALTVIVVSQILDPPPGDRRRSDHGRVARARRAVAACASAPCSRSGACRSRSPSRAATPAATCRPSTPAPTRRPRRGRP